MRILISNDDGIQALGLRLLAGHLSKKHEIIVIAPETEQSGVGHGFTHSRPLRLRDAEFDGIAAYTINGTPADCVRIGLAMLYEKWPDIVISGINHGFNAGLDVFYSGTVAAAMEGAMRSIPSIAVSCRQKPDVHYEEIFSIVDRVIALIEKGVRFEKTVLSINVPHGEVKGLRIVKGDTTPDTICYKACEGEEEGKYFCIGEYNPLSTVDDMGLLKKGYATLTPLKADLNNYEALSQLQNIEV